MNPHATNNRPRITRTLFSQIPVDLLEQCRDRKGTAIVYLWLFFYQLHEQGFPCTADLAQVCRMSENDIRKSKRWLAENGWIRIQRVPGCPDNYQILMEPDHAQ